MSYNSIIIVISTRTPKSHRAPAHVNLNRPPPVIFRDLDVAGLHDLLSSPIPRVVPLLDVGNTPRVFSLEDLPQVLLLSQAPKQR